MNCLVCFFLSDNLLHSLIKKQLTAIKLERLQQLVTSALVQFRLSGLELTRVEPFGGDLYQGKLTEGEGSVQMTSLY